MAVEWAGGAVRIEAVVGVRLLAVADDAMAAGCRVADVLLVCAAEGALMSSSIELSRLSRSSTGCLLTLLAAAYPLPPAATVTLCTALALAAAAGWLLCSSSVLAAAVDEKREVDELL